MFTINPTPTFKLDVTIPSPTGGGKVGVIFKHKGRKALAEFVKSLTEEGSTRTDLDGLLEIIVGWDGVQEPFSKEALESLLDNYPAAAKAIYDVYFPAVSEGTAARKN